MVFAACAYLLFYVVLRPSNTLRKEIFKGVYYSCLDVPKKFGDGKVMITEIHWDDPGVELFFRRFYPASSGRPHFTLLPADYLLWKYDLSVMINSTRYLPGEWWKSFPSRKVDSLETLVWDGEVSHIHEHSYLFGWDEEGNFLVETRKPPSTGFLDSLKWGIGIQSISILDGELRMSAMNKEAGPDSRTLFGVDAEKKILWFLVFDHVTELGMNTVGRDAGVMIGAQLDASDASTLIIGPGARGIPPFTGIRGRRPLAAVFGIRAEPLDEN